MLLSSVSPTVATVSTEEVITTAILLVGVTVHVNISADGYKIMLVIRPTHQSPPLPEDSHNN